MNKKRILVAIGVSAIAVAVAFNFNISLRGESLSYLSLAYVEALAECEESIEKKGSIIVVTVCDRKTSVGGQLLNLNCDADDSTPCSFTN